MLILKNGLLIDPVTNSEAVRDLYIENGKIIRAGDISAEKISKSEIIDISGMCAAPGIVDMHVHFRDPGFTHKEDILSGSAAAAAGGVTTVVCMPNTNPVADNAETLDYIRKKAADAPVNVLSYGAVTSGQAGGELTDFLRLREAGAVALSDDGCAVDSAAIMRRALRAAKDAGMLISCHCEYTDMVQNYALNEGEISLRLGMPGRPAIAEELMIARDIMLAEEIGARVHIAHVSTAKSADIIRAAKMRGVLVTAETCPQYFTLTEDEIIRQGAMARVNPPLRTEKDRAAIEKALFDGTIDAIATDHAPHTSGEKGLGLEGSPSGMVGLETSLALAVTKLHIESGMTLPRLFRLMSYNPSRILGLSGGTLAPGADANITVFAPDEKWVVDPSKFKSKSRNTPFASFELSGKVKYTICGGKIVFKEGKGHVV